MKKRAVSRVEQVPLDKITVINPRARNRKVFEGMVKNIGQLGLKRPITVIRKTGADGDSFDLVCGQGRVEAYKALGQTEIPALVVEATEEDGLVMSLVENIARRRHRAIDLLHDIEGMKRRGHSEEQIALKTDLTLEYVRGVIHLIENGEDRLLRAVEWGAIPISVAMQIAKSGEGNVQEALQQAYENGVLKSKQITYARQLVEQRRRHGRAFIPSGRNGDRKVPTLSLVRMYQQDVERKRYMMRKAEATRDRLTFVVQALRTLFADAELLRLLRAEGVDTLPRNLASRLQAA